MNKNDQNEKNPFERELVPDDFEFTRNDNEKIILSVINDPEKSIDFLDIHKTPFVLLTIIKHLQKNKDLLSNKKFFEFLKNKISFNKIGYVNSKLTQYILDLFGGNSNPSITDNIDLKNGFCGGKISRIENEIVISVSQNQSLYFDSFLINETDDNSDFAPSIHDVTGEDSFSGDINEDGYTKDQLDFNYFFHSPLREIIESDFSIKFSDYRSDSLFCFLNIIKDADDETVSKIKEIITTHGNNVIDIFSILNNNQDKSSDFIKFLLDVEPIILKNILSKYSKIINSYSFIFDFIKSDPRYTKKAESFFGVTDPEFIKVREVGFDADSISSKIVKVAKMQLLDHIMHDNADSGIFEKLEVEILVVNNFLRLKKSRGEFIDLISLKQFSFDRGIVGEKIPPENITTMRQMYRENYDEYPELTKILLDSFEKSLKNTDSKFTILRYKDDITGFYRTDYVDDETLHFAAFNVDKQFHGSGLGEAIMLSDLDLMAKNKKIVAECNPHVGISPNYIERGFVATKWGPVAEIEVLNIERDDANFDFVTKKESGTDWSQEKIVERYLRSELGQVDGGNKAEHFYEENNIRIYSASEMKGFDFQSIVSDGRVITRYFKFPKKGDKKDLSWYIVTEKNKN